MMEQDDGAAGAATDMMGAEASPAPETGQEQAGQPDQSGMVHIPADMLPEECRDCQAGTKLTFTVVAPADAEGDIPLEYDSMSEAPKEEAWEDTFRKEMSPRSTNESPSMPEDQQEAY